MNTGENQPMKSKENRNRKMRLGKQFLNLLCVFEEARRNSEFIFLLNKAGCGSEGGRKTGGGGGTGEGATNQELI